MDADISIMDGDGRSALAAAASHDEGDHINIMDDEDPAAHLTLKRVGAAGKMRCSSCRFGGEYVPLPHLRMWRTAAYLVVARLFDLIRCARHFAGEGAELVAFPGVNAPLPEDADPLAWGGGTQVTFLTVKLAALSMYASKSRKVDARHSALLIR